MKRHLTLLAAGLATLASLSAPRAFGFAELARGKLTATARMSLEYDSNIFANSAETADWSAIFSPSLNYSRTAGMISTTATLGMNAITFQDTNGQDSIDPNVSVTFNVDRAEKGAFAQTLSYQRSSAANDVLNTRAKSDEYRGATKLDYYFSEKTGFRFNADYRLSDFLSNGYNNVRSYTVGGGVVYRYSPKLTASLTGTYNPEDATNLGPSPVSDPSSKNYRVRLGLEGELAPKLNGSVGVGVVRREFERGGNTSSMLLSTALNWTATEKTNVSLSASNDFDTSPGAESLRILSTTLGVRQELNAKLSVGASVSYQHTRFNQEPGPVSRTDDATTFLVNTSYRMNDYWTLGGSLSHRLNNSTLAVADYNRDVANVSATLTF